MCHLELSSYQQGGLFIWLLINFLLPLLDTLPSTLAIREGSIALVFRDTYKAKHIKTDKYTTFEHQIMVQMPAM